MLGVGPCRDPADPVLFNVKLIILGVKLLAFMLIEVVLSLPACSRLSVFIPRPEPAEFVEFKVKLCRVMLLVLRVAEGVWLSVFVARRFVVVSILVSIPP